MQSTLAAYDNCAVAAPSFKFVTALTHLGQFLLHPTHQLLSKST
jgi:hypothetical protein